MEKINNIDTDIYTNVSRRELSPTDYVLYNEKTDWIGRWAIHGGIILFGNKCEVIYDCMDNEKIIPCTELPKHYQDELLIQINSK